MPRAGGIANSRSTIIAIVIAGATFVLALLPMYQPRPRQVTAMLTATYKCIAVACLTIATLGYFSFAYVLEPAAIALSGAILAIALPVWFWMLRRRDTPKRILVVGDNPSSITLMIQALPIRPVGFLSPRLDEQVSDTRSFRQVTANDLTDDNTAATDGGLPSRTRSVTRIDGVSRLSGLSQLEYVLRERDVDTVALAFGEADREEFFGTLRTCRENGVNVIVHESFAENVLVKADQTEQLVTVDLKLRPWYSHVTKRAFDLVFASIGLVMLAPLCIVIAVAIKLDSSGPVFYSQTRTLEFGKTATVVKFRSMQTDAEAESGAKLSDEDAGEVDARVTRVGRFLRKTHLDEIPQLGSILTGDMSVVGPRPERPEFDAEIQGRGIHWEKRWILKPGLTGLAQVNDVTGFDSERKLRYDLEYARKRTFWLDMKLVALQIWTIIVDTADLVSDRVLLDRNDTTTDDQLSEK